MILLSITITNGWLLFICVILGIYVWSVLIGIQKNNQLKNKNIELSEIIKLNERSKVEFELKQKSAEAEMRVSLQNWALEELEKFKKNEMEKVHRAAQEQWRQQSITLLQRWKIEEESKIRQDAINRSYSVNLGKITEHLIPFHSSFLSQFNPKDARFIGSPIDLIVFDGYADKRDDIQIYLVEIKTGNSKLTDIQKKIKYSVLNGNIRWAEITP